MYLYLIDLLRWLIFLLISLTETLMSCSFWIYLLLLTPVSYSRMVFFPFGNFIKLSQFPLAFCQSQKGEDYDYSCTNCDGLCGHLRDVHGRISLNSALLLLPVNFMSGFRLVLMPIPLIVIISGQVSLISMVFLYWCHTS